MLKWLFGRRGRGGKSLSVDLAFALIFNTNVLVLWYISDRVFLPVLFLFHSSHLMSLVIGGLTNPFSCTCYAYHHSNKCHVVTNGIQILKV
jgi:hypothetical protein